MNTDVIEDSNSEFERRYAEVTRLWLERRFALDEQGKFVAHEPIYGLLSDAATEGGHLRRSARIFDSLMFASRFAPESLLDVGGAEGYLTALAERGLGVTAVSSDISREVCGRAGECCGVPAVSLNASALPFADSSFDVIVITEVLEHLVDPIGALLEARRVAKKAVVFSTEEFAASEELRSYILGQRQFEGHGERNILAAEDFDLAFEGWKVHLDQQRDPLHPEAISPDAEGIRAWLSGKFEVTGLGVIGFATPQEAPEATAALAEEGRQALIDLMLHGVASHKTGESPNTPDPAVIRDRLRPGLELAEVPVSGGGRAFDAYTFRVPTEAISEYAEALQLSSATREGLLALNARFQMRPERRRKEWWAHELLDPAYGWSPIFCAPAEDNGLRVENDDPHLISPYLFMPTEWIDGVIVEMELPAEIDIDCCEIYYQLDGEMVFSHERRRPAPFKRSAGTTWVGIDLTGLRQEGRHLVRFRIDPILSCPEEPIRVNRIALIGHAAS